MKPVHNIGTPSEVGTKNVAFTAAAASVTAMPSTTTAVRVVATTDCFVVISTVGTVATTTTGFYLPLGKPEIFSVNGAVIVSAIRATANGVIYVTPMG